MTGLLQRLALGLASSDEPLEVFLARKLERALSMAPEDWEVRQAVVNFRTRLLQQLGTGQAG